MGGNYYNYKYISAARPCADSAARLLINLGARAYLGAHNWRAPLPAGQVRVISARAPTGAIEFGQWRARLVARQASIGALYLAIGRNMAPLIDC